MSSFDIIINYHAYLIIFKIVILLVTTLLFITYCIMLLLTKFKKGGKGL